MLVMVSILFIVGTFLLLAIARISADVEEKTSKGWLEQIWDEALDVWDEVWEFGAEDSNDASGSAPDYPDNGELDDDSDDGEEWSGSTETDDTWRYA